MEYQLSGDTVTCYVEGRITSDNAEDFAKTITSASKDPRVTCVVLDVGKLAYISSAGLRVIMSLLRSHLRVKVINAPSSVYSVFRMTGLTEIMEVRRAIREMPVSGLKQIGAGACGKVYRVNAEQVVKVYDSDRFTPERVEREREIAKQTLIHGIPTAIPFETVRVGEERGIVYELVDAHNIGEVVSADPESCEVWARRMAVLAAEIHATEFEDGLLPDARRIYLNWVDKMEAADVYGDATISALRAFVEAIPVTNTFVHGDFHPANVMVLPDDELLLIDMGDASVGHPGMDVAGSYHVMRVAAKRQDGAQRFCNMPFDLLSRFWDVFVREYYDTRDDAAVAELEANLALAAMPRSMGTNAFTKFIEEDERMHVAAEMERRFLAGCDSVRWDLLG